MKTLLKDAGYREKVYAKSVLAQGGLMTYWPDMLEAVYDPSRDTIQGMGRVQWEGTRSKEILAEHGLDDGDCLADYRPYQPKTGQACSCRPGQERDNCPQCEGTGQRIDFKAIRERGAR